MTDADVTDAIMMEQFRHWLMRPEGEARVLGLILALEGMSEKARNHVREMLEVVKR